MRLKLRIARHEHMADGIVAGLGQFDALASHFLAEEAVGKLHQHAGAVAHQRISADGAAMRQVFEHRKAVLDDLMRLHALHVDDEADAAGIVLVARIVQAVRSEAGVGALNFGSGPIFDGWRFRLRGRAVRRRWRHFRHRPVLHPQPLGRWFPLGSA